MNRAEIMGRNMLITVFVVMGIIEVSSDLFTIARFTGRDTVFTCVRLLLTVGLMYALYSGHVWAKRLLIILLCLASLIVAGGFMRTRSLILATLLISNILCFFLLRSEQLKAFMLYQKKKREAHDA
jgi:hypothetical protein